MNIKKILNDFNIEYREYNDEWINVCCPYCVSANRRLPDYEFLRGINLKNQNSTCFRCKKTVFFDDLIVDLTGLDKNKIESSIENIHDPKENLVDKAKSFFIKTENTKVKTEIDVEEAGILLNDRNIEVFKELKSFLKNRNLSKETIFKYKCRYTRTGRYAYRLIMPIYYENKLVCFQARDITNKKKNKYDTPPNSNLKDYIYILPNSDFNEKIYVVEGIIDSWGMEYNCLATFGKGISPNQKRKILQQNPKELIFALDADAFKNTFEIAREFSLRTKTGYVLLPKGSDPDTLRRKGVESLDIHYMN